jgi:hypothetical protein
MLIRGLFKDTPEILLYFIVLLEGQRKDNFRKDDGTGNLRKYKGA